MFTIRARDFTISPISTFTTIATADYSVSAITAADVEHGLVTADAQNVPGDSWVALPLVFHIGLTNYSVSTTLTYAYSTGGGADFRPRRYDGCRNESRNPSRP